jgi:hypothetical protein
MPRTLRKEEVIGSIAGIDFSENKRVVGVVLEVAPGSYILSVGKAGKVIEIPKRIVKRVLFSIRKDKND